MPDSRVGLRLKPVKPRRTLPELPERWRDVLAAIVAQQADLIGLVGGEDIDVPAVGALTALVTAPSAWVTLPDDGSPGGDGVLIELVAAGFVVPWDLPNGDRVWTLTPYGAARLRVEIAERGPDDEPHWHGMGCPRRPVRLPRREGEVSFLDGAQFEAPRSGPIEELMMDAEDEDRPVRLFAGPDGSNEGGYTVPIDRRLGGGGKARRKKKHPAVPGEGRPGGSGSGSGSMRSERSAGAVG